MVNPSEHEVFGLIATEEATGRRTIRRELEKCSKSGSELNEGGKDDDPG